MCVYVSNCIYMQTKYLQKPTEIRKGIGSHETGVTEGCELHCGFWELNLGPLTEKEVQLLTVEPIKGFLLKTKTFIEK